MYLSTKRSVDQPKYTKFHRGKRYSVSLNSLWLALSPAEHSGHRAPLKLPNSRARCPKKKGTRPFGRVPFLIA